jgi:hypothetical protein
LLQALERKEMCRSFIEECGGGGPLGRPGPNNIIKKKNSMV